MVTVHAPDGRIIADISDNVEEIITWMISRNDRPRWRYTQDQHTGTITLKADADVDKVMEYLRTQRYTADFIGN